MIDRRRRLRGRCWLRSAWWRMLQLNPCTGYVVFDLPRGSHSVTTVFYCVNVDCHMFVYTGWNCGVSHFASSRVSDGLLNVLYMMMFRCDIIIVYVICAISYSLPSEISTACYGLSIDDTVIIYFQLSFQVFFWTSDYYLWKLPLS
jgi:hypothetical protein